MRRSATWGGRHSRGGRAERIEPRACGSDDTRMRLAWLVTLLLAGTAHADQKLQSFKPEFVRGGGGCQVHLSGLTRVLAGAPELAKPAPADRVELEQDVEQLTRGVALVK